MLSPCELCKIWVDDENGEEPRGFVKLTIIDILYSRVIMFEFVFNLKIWRVIIGKGSECPNATLSWNFAKPWLLLKKC